MLGGIAWTAALAAFLLPAWSVATSLAAWLGIVAWRRRHGGPGASQAAWLVSAAAVCASTMIQAESVAQTPVERLAAKEASVRGNLVVCSDPVLERGSHGGYVRFRASLVEVSGRGERFRLRAPVLVLADPGWSRVQLGARVRVSGRLSPADGQDLAGVLATRGPPVVLSQPAAVLRAADRVRAGIRQGVAGQSVGPRTLVPALVDGDDVGMPDEITEDFRTS